MTSKSSPSSSSSPSSHWNYDVFLSFRGKDVRKTFVDHLYFSLHQKGIFTFKDDERLERGKSIGPELLKSIEQSRFAVVVFSRTYANSSWCLDELAKIMECRELKGQTVLPFFYNVKPSELRKQEGCFGEMFAELHGSDKVGIWRAALFQAASLSGWDLKNTADGHESKCIQQIVREILSKLGGTVSSEVEGLVGMESRIAEVNSLLGTGLSDVRIVGIWGLSGIGKTTLARAVFSQISYQFEAASFLHEVGKASKQHGLEHVLEKLLSEILMVKDLKINNVYEGINLMKSRLRVKRVLLVLDDINCLDQLEVLARKHDWFGPGSRIIITTRDKQLLVHEVDEIHQASLLNDGEAIQLFSWKAFKDTRPPKDFEELSYQVIRYTGGLPLALRVLGSALYGRDMTMWRSSLDRLIKEGPEGEVLEKLKIGFDGLKETEKKSFLDVACFFEGKDKDYVTRILDSFDFYPDISLSVLIEKSLIYILKNRLYMHQLIREMGWHIVRRNFHGEPGKHSRLWLTDDIVHVLTRSTGTENIEGIRLHFPEQKYVNIGSEAFRKMDKLRLVEIHNACVPRGPEYLPDQLRWLDWDEFPSNSMPPRFQPENLVGLRLHFSSIILLWNGKKIMDKLKYMDLTNSSKLIRAPDFTETPNLESLVLGGCTSLVEVHPSIGALKNLVLLDLSGCENLRSLPKTIHLESLKVFRLSGCYKLEKLPQITENMEHLLEVNLLCTAIKELPPSIGRLPNLAMMNLSFCRKLNSLPSTFSTLKCLKYLVLWGCSKLDKLPHDLGNLQVLEELHLVETAIQELPSSIGNLTSLVLIDLKNCKYLTSLPSTICLLKHLKTLSLAGCSKLEKLPEELGDLECLRDLSLYGTAITQAPPSIGRLINLETLSFRGCRPQKAYESWRTSPFTYLFGPRKRQRLMSVVLPSLLGLRCLHRLDLRNCEMIDGAIPTDLGCLPNIVDLNLGGNNFVNIPSINGLPRLRSLVLAGCKMLQALPELPPSLVELYADDCSSLRGFSKIFHEEVNLGSVSFRNCLLLLEGGQSNNISSKYWKQVFQGRYWYGDCLESIILPGREILQWFSNQSVGSSISVKLPPNCLNDKFRGLGITAVFESITKARTSLRSCGERMKYLDVKFRVIVPPIECDAVRPFSKMTHESIDSEHVCLAYIRFYDFLEFNRMDTSPSDWREIEVSIDSQGQSVAVVKKWGIRLIYEDDIKQMI